MRGTLAERMDAKTDKTGECWLWTAGVGSHGYGQIYSRNVAGARTQVLAHRASYELNVGPIPEGLQIDHLCRNRLCVRPDHLEAVTQRTNILRSDSPSAVAARRDTCSRGHDLDEENTRRTADGRHCRACSRLRWAKTDTPERRATARERTRRWTERKQQASAA